MQWLPLYLHLLTPQCLRRLCFLIWILFGWSFDCIHQELAGMLYSQLNFYPCLLWISNKFLHRCVRQALKQDLSCLLIYLGVTKTLSQRQGTLRLFHWKCWSCETHNAEGILPTSNSQLLVLNRSRSHIIFPKHVLN